MKDTLKTCFSASAGRRLLFLFLITGALSLLRDASAQSLPRFETHFAKSKIGKVESQESAHFKVSWVHPQDSILAGPLLTYLESAFEPLKSIFASAQLNGLKAPVEIFPDLKSFSEVSGLSLARFRATGTIALTLEQRLMILSPRTLVKGYPWAETAVHELIHFLIRRISPENVPIWLHEGTAQIYQGFPAVRGFQMDPAQWGLFKRRRDQKKLLDLKTLREPFPYRETPEETELAYIQALLFTNYLDKKCGVVRLIEWSAHQQSIDPALQRCTKMSLPQLEAIFISEVMARIEVPKNSDVQFFARDFSSTDPLEAEGKAANQRSRNLAQLSSEMFKQGRHRAAAIEMEKALVKSGVAPPSWRHQLAKSLLKIGKINDAKIVLNRVIDDYPRDGSAYFILGNLAYEKSEFERAWRFFVRAYFLNPFLDGLFEKMLVIQQRKPELAKDYVILDAEL